MEKDEKIVFSTEDGDVEFYVLEQTMVSGTNYILVTDDLTAEEGSFLILKETMMEHPDSKEEIATYGVIENEEELTAIIKVFDDLLDDVDLEV